MPIDMQQIVLCQCLCFDKNTQGQTVTPKTDGDMEAGEVEN